MEPNKDNKSDQVSKYKCALCEFKTHDVSLLFSHRCKMSKCDEVLHELEDSTDEDSSTTTTKKEYTCSVCNFSTCSLSVHEEHKMKHKKRNRFPCKVCNKVFDDLELVLNHVNTHQPKNFKCGLCFKAFLDKDLLMAHLEKHEPNYTVPPPTTYQNTDAAHTDDVANTDMETIHIEANHHVDYSMNSNTTPTITSMDDASENDMPLSLDEPVLMSDDAVVPNQESRHNSSDVVIQEVSSLYNNINEYENNLQED